jgi:hypothetical protein
MAIVLSDFLVHSCWGLHLNFKFYKLEVLEVFMSSIELSLWMVANIVCSCLCLFDAIIELHAMDEETFNDFLIGK